MCGGKRALFTSPAVSQAPILGLVFGTYLRISMELANGLAASSIGTVARPTGIAITGKTGAVSVNWVRSQPRWSGMTLFTSPTPDRYGMLPVISYLGARVNW